MQRYGKTDTSAAGFQPGKNKTKSPGRREPNCQTPNKKLHEFSISNIRLPGLSEYRPSIRITKGFCVSLNELQGLKQQPLRNTRLRKAALIGPNPVRVKIVICFLTPPSSDGNLHIPVPQIHFGDLSCRGDLGETEETVTWDLAERLSLPLMIYYCHCVRPHDPFRPPHNCPGRPDHCITESG